MPRLYRCIFLVCFPFCWAAAQDVNPAEARLREALRATTLQLRAAQTDLATAQAAQSSLVEEKNALSAQLESLRKKANEEKSIADKSGAELGRRVAAQAQKIKELDQSLSSAENELRKISETAGATKVRLDAVESENIVLRRRIADRETKNLALFVLGNEILSRYEDYSLGKALLAKEPFIGTRRTKLENLVQDYEDRLTEQLTTR